MSCARHSPKLVLLVLNFLLFVSAVTFLVTGLWLLVITGLFETDIKRLLDTIEYDGVKIGTFLFSATLLFIIAGGVLLFVAVFGAVTAWKKVKGCLVVSSDWLEGQLLKQLEGYQGPTATDQTSKSFNQLFMKVLAVILACLTLDRAKNRIQHVDAVVKNKFNVTKTKALGGKKF
ncbi:hypothetical protein MAR_020558 [Mya arenaria]|uniref:Tetraspanin n=1 Tax=Mya arenaria TaxID=6604 RepID=A0ABY7E7L0_MYAAR|nr:hypothetical protein MAR_020558 [Mya arenaria]